MVRMVSVTFSGSRVSLAAAAPPGLLPAREQMALSLGFHIILACFGVAFPAIIFLMHRRAVVRGDAAAARLTRRWAKVAGLLFAIGAVSGTVLSFEMGLLWPGLMGRFGDVLGLPFAIEGLSFFVEAIFLGVYLYGFDRLPPRVHLLTIIPMGAAGVVGTFCVTAVNAWMNEPTGFTLRDGIISDVQPWRVLFNDGVWLEFGHMWVGAFMVVGFVVAGVYAAGMLRGRVDAHHRLGFTVPFAVASVATVMQPLIGHVLGLQVGNRQPAKLAALELNPVTEPGPAPLKLGGFLVDGHERWALPIPKIGSIITRNSWDAPVPGLDTVPKPDWPPVNITHWSFQIMIGIGTLLAVAVVAFWVARRRGRDPLTNRWCLRFAVIAGPLAILALESGWTATEVGRQPWTVWHVLRTSDAASMATGLWWSYTGVLVLYLAMSVGAIVVLRSMARRWRAGEEDLPSAYTAEMVDEEPRLEPVP
jgi:cytochrome bd ubiquinol oxidase subunit I